MHLEHPDNTPCLVFANDRGEIKDFPELLMAGQSGRRYFRPALYDLIPLPPGSDLFVLPDRNPIGIDPTTGEPVMP
ncbi:MAG: radical SAM protein, partial [Desulfobulbaceae bacterium]|nr:radical SAM protein [Desulfobulbaceae bacterium]